MKRSHDEPFIMVLCDGQFCAHIPLLNFVQPLIPSEGLGGGRVCELGKE